MNTAKLCILVVEDETDDQVLIRTAFRKIAPSTIVHVVGSGNQAITYLMGEGKYSDRAEYPYPTFIVTDLKMPDGDGFSVLEHLKSNPTWAVIPVVVLSSSSDPDDIRTAYMLGASSYHLKPNGYDLLSEQLRTIYQYWKTCQIPEVQTSGQQVRTASKGKLGERFVQPPQRNQRRSGG